MDGLHPGLIALRPRDARPGVPRLVVRVVLVIALAQSACSPPTLLESTFESDEAVARAVLDGLARKDLQGLLGLALTREEFEDLVWPTLPVSRPEVGMPFAYIWNDHSTKSRTYLGQTLAMYGGRRFELLRIEFAGQTTEHGSCSITRESRLIVRDEEGQEQTVRVFGGIIRQNGHSKVYSYIVD
jgi:hypothetical protein